MKKIIEVPIQYILEELMIKEKKYIFLMELKQFTRYLNIIFLNKINHVLSLLKFFIMYKNSPGDYCERVIPDPIPNSEVKPFSADGT